MTILRPESVPPKTAAEPSVEIALAHGRQMLWAMAVLASECPEIEADALALVDGLAGAIDTLLALTCRWETADEKTEEVGGVLVAQGRQTLPKGGAAC